MPKSKLSHELFLNIKPQTDWKGEILKNIAYSGAADTSVKIIIANHTNLNNILDLANGRPRLTKTALKRFNLILSQPQSLAGFDKKEIHCCLCNKTISYPVWYYEVKYAVNHFHYFICFSASPNNDNTKPNVSCYRKVQ